MGQLIHDLFFVLVPDPGPVGKTIRSEFLLPERVRVAHDDACVDPEERDGVQAIDAVMLFLGPTQHDIELARTSIGNIVGVTPPMTSSRVFGNSLERRWTRVGMNNR
jgi:hypothetical protein